MVDISVGKQMMADSKFYTGYSRWIDGEDRYETWEESVERVMNMHREYYKDVMTDRLAEMINFAERRYKKKKVVGSQRALQFGGEQIFSHHARLYNCGFTYIDRPEVFQELMYALLCGCGVGFSVQKHHVEKLPMITKRHDNQSEVYVIPDSIEGWSMAFGILLSSFLEMDAPSVEYQGKHVAFDFSEIRPKGAHISGGFKAPGPDGLRAALSKCEELLSKEVRGQDGGVEIRPIVAYDFIMYMADAVLSGGVRRSATIAVFSKDDEEMMNAKMGDWFVTNPQRGRSNNSALLLRDEVTREEFHKLMECAKFAGEPGFIFAESTEHGFNPCVEIGLRSYTTDGQSGFQFCNLSSINGAKVESEEDFIDSCKAAAILGTLQAGYTKFKFLSDATREITERESLIGVSVTGWMNNPDLLFQEQVMRNGANEVKYTNKVMAKLLGINPAARTTTTKPEGNTSVMLGSASGIHGEHSPLYIRHVQFNDQDEVLHLINEKNPKMIEDSVWSTGGTDKVVAFPVTAKAGSMFKSDLMGVKQLEYVKHVQSIWVEEGTNVDLCVDPTLRHNVSNTITVDDWDEVEAYIYDNRKYFAGVSLLSAMGDKAYPQAPFTEVFKSDHILEKYGDASLFASGLIEAALDAFGDLWKACDAINGWGEKLDKESHHHLMKRDWVRRAKKFANNYFDGDILEMTNCLKDCNNLHKWHSIIKDMEGINFAAELCEKHYVEVDTMGAVACSAGKCDL